MSDEQAGLERVVREAFLEEASELLRRIDVEGNELRTHVVERRGDHLRSILRLLHTLKGAASAVGDLGIRDETHALESALLALPLDAAWGDDVYEAFGASLGRLHAGLGALVSATNGSRGLGNVPGAVESHDPRTSQELLRVRPERVESLYALASELIVLRQQWESHARQLTEVRDALSELASASRRRGQSIPETPRAARERARVASAEAASSEALHGLHRNVAELVRDLGSVQAQLASVTAGMVDGIATLRLLPLRPVFEEYVKVAREAARDVGKEVRVTIRAERAEIDRGVISRLREPLLHLVRNAVAHGIEPAAERVARGKPPVGHILLEGHCEGSRAILRVVDDGRGVDAGRVRARAIELGMLDAAANEELGDERLLDFLCRPGFSTATVTDRLAGRGIGLDVVADVVRALDGKMALDTVSGDGTSFLLDVPVVASTSSVLIVRALDRTFAFPTGQVDRIVRLRAEDLTTLGDTLLYTAGDDKVAVITLTDVLASHGSELPSYDGARAALVRVGRRRLLVIVDDVEGEQSLVVRPMPDAFAAARLYVGAGVLDDGSILPVIDGGALFEHAEKGRTTRRIAPRAPLSRAEPRTSTVLVVDDSATMRAMLRNVLRASGYDVHVAEDGVEALSMLERMPACDLVVTDLEMPRLDGVALSRAIRDSARSEMPIVMVTSIQSDEQTQKALEAGVDAYVVKSGFEQGRFLGLVAKLLVERGVAA